MKEKNMDIVAATKKIKEGGDLTEVESEAVMEGIFSSHSDETSIRELLVAWYQKKEKAAELVGAARFLRSKMVRITGLSSPIFDCCGTGGDGRGTFNFSTTAAFVVASCGVVVAKHGNRAVSSSCGSSDLLLELGIPQNADVSTLQECLKQNNLTFLFAPLFHPLLAKVAPIRKSIPHRSIFNLLGPLVNPASASRQLVGLSEVALLDEYAQALQSLGTERAILVSSHDGLDEFSLTGPAHVIRISPESRDRFEFDPQVSGYPYCQLSELRGRDAKFNAQRLELCLRGHSEALDHTVHMNAAWALIAAGKAENFLDALLLAQEAITSGRALQKLNDLKNFFRRHSQSKT